MPAAADDPKYQSAAPLCPDQMGHGIIISPDTRRDNRLPPGQARTRKWPVLHYGRVPFIKPEDWRLEVGGLVDRPVSLSWDDFQRLPRVSVFADFHCVTRWSRLGNVWEGVSVHTILAESGVGPRARYIVATGYDDGWTTNLPLADFNVEDALFADRHDGVRLSADHGGPVRLIVPRLYAWKSAKWVQSVELIDEDRPGLWERLGYHDHGDPWTEERYRG